jgi:transcriptional regulator with XRE-family HTH domain
MAKSKKKAQSDDTYSADVKKLGKRIKALRVEQGYTSAMKFAYDNDLSSVQMVRWEQGRNMTFETQLKLAKAFGISVAELLKDF